MMQRIENVSGRYIFDITMILVVGVLILLYCVGSVWWFLFVFLYLCFDFVVLYSGDRERVLYFQAIVAILY